MMDSVVDRRRAEDEISFICGDWAGVWSCTVKAVGVDYAPDAALVSIRTDEGQVRIPLSMIGDICFEVESYIRGATRPSYDELPIPEDKAAVGSQQEIGAGRTASVEKGIIALMHEYESIKEDDKVDCDWKDHYVDGAVDALKRALRIVRESDQRSAPDLS